MNNLDQYNDNELFDLLNSDKKTAEMAFAELYLRHSPRIYAYCRRFLGNKNDAQDVFQDTFVRFVESSKKPRLMTNVPAYLLKIARNLCVNVKRHEKYPVTFEDYMVPDDHNNDNDELLKLIKMAIDILPVEYKDIFILREYDGLTYTEIAEVTNTTLAAVKIKLFRAKQKVREILSPYLSELNKYL
jgi:RNA polymerase sigma-70 factor (ECF subfamily)